MSKSKKSRYGAQRLPAGNIRIKIRMYHVGFGDCLLVSFAYADGKNRHILFDCGTSSEKKDHMLKIVKMISGDCGGHLDGLVITHRHRDHLSAFGLKGVGDILESLKPDIVVRPWTEHPNAAAQAKTAPSVFTPLALSQMRSLSAAQQFAEFLSKGMSAGLPGASKAMQQRIRALADDNVKNKTAIDRLNRMAKATKGAYVYAGSPSGLEEMLPGVRVTVLGPPTLEQSKDIKSQTDWDPAEFWKLQKKMAATMQNNATPGKGSSSLFPKAATVPVSDAPSHLKWVIDKLDKGHTQNIQRIVRALDNAMNNTSVILLLEIEDRVLLLPGDAQLENWQYALQTTGIAEKLKNTGIYKVGHHGSTNATPKSLWNLFANRSLRQKPGRLISLLSTQRGEHNQVPRKSLVDALDAETTLYSTEKSEELCRVIDF